MRTFLIFLGCVAFLYVALVVGLSAYDGGTRRHLVNLAAKELPPRASISETDDFMRRHTHRYAVDDTFNFQFGGFVEQYTVDKLLFNRQVSIVLKFNRTTKKYDSCEVEVFYTFL